MSPYADTDIDLFLYGLNEKEAEEKIHEIFELIRSNLRKHIPAEYKSNILEPQNQEYLFQNVFIMRTQNSVSFYCDFPIRPVQIVLRLYSSPSEILASFDVDCCACGFDGKHVWASPRGIRALETRCNIVDVSRRSQVYEDRLYKYAKRGYRVAVPGYIPNKMDRLMRTFHHDPAETGLLKLMTMEDNLRRPLKPLTMSYDHFGCSLTAEKPCLYEHCPVPYSPSFNPRAEYWGLFHRNKCKYDKPCYVIALNNLDPIMYDDMSMSNISDRLQWITQDHDSMVGSFHQYEENFYAEAYKTHHGRTKIWRDE